MQAASTDKNSGEIQRKLAVTLVRKYYALYTVLHMFMQVLFELQDYPGREQ